jgi:hypothetical protein
MAHATPLVFGFIADAMDYGARVTERAAKGFDANQNPAFLIKAAALRTEIAVLLC